MKFKNKLNELLKDEKSAPKNYKQLIRLTESKQDKMKLKRIIKDERNHFKILNKIKGEKK